LESGHAFNMYKQLKGLIGQITEGEGLDSLPSEIRDVDGYLVDTSTGEVIEAPQPDEDPEHLAETGSQEPMEKAEQAVEEVIEA